MIVWSFGFRAVLAEQECLHRGVSEAPGRKWGGVDKGLHPPFPPASHSELRDMVSLGKNLISFHYRKRLGSTRTPCVPLVIKKTNEGRARHTARGQQSRDGDPGVQKLHHSQ